MQLSVQQAQINTAKVEIKTLTVNGKQVTMGLFRQLLQSDWLDYEGKECGQAWGTVNYFFAPCVMDHLHVVWQSGESLRRFCLFERVPYGRTEEARNYLRLHTEAWGLRSCLEAPPVWDTEAKCFVWESGKRWSGAGVVESFRQSFTSGYPVMRSRYEDGGYRYSLDTEAVTKLLHERHLALGTELPSSEEHWKARELLEAEIKAVVTNWKEAWVKASGLPQLFIAV